MICKVRGLMPVGNFSSAKLRGISSPVSRFFIITLARISYGKNKVWSQDELIRLQNLEQNRSHLVLHIILKNDSLIHYIFQRKFKLNLPLALQHKCYQPLQIVKQLNVITSFNFIDQKWSYTDIRHCLTPSMLVCN